MKSPPPPRRASPWRAGPPPAPLTQSILDPGAPNPDGRSKATTDGFCLCSPWPGLEPSSPPGTSDAFSGLLSLHLPLEAAPKGSCSRRGLRGPPPPTFTVSLPPHGPTRTSAFPNPRSENKDCLLSPTTLDCGMRGCIKSVSGCSQGARGTRPGVDPDTFLLRSGNVHPKLRQTHHGRSGMFSESRHRTWSRSFHPSMRTPRIILMSARRSFRPLA